MATTSEYFANTAVYCGPSIADDNAQFEVDEISRQFDKFLKAVGCKRTPNSEWYYCSQCSGLHATWDVWDLLYFEPVEVDRDEFESFWCDHIFIEAWNKRYPRMRAIYEWLNRNEYHLNDAPYEYRNNTKRYEYLKRKHRRFDDRWDIVYAEYERTVQEALDEVCRLCEEAFEDACDYAYSEEAAKEWAEAQE